MLVVTDVHGRKHIMNIEAYRHHYRLSKTQDRYTVAFESGHNLTVSYRQLMMLLCERLKYKYKH